MLQRRSLLIPQSDCPAAVGLRSAIGGANANLHEIRLDGPGVATDSGPLGWLRNDRLRRPGIFMRT